MSDDGPVLSVSGWEPTQPRQNTYMSWPSSLENPTRPMVTLEKRQERLRLIEAALRSEVQAGELLLADKSYLQLSKATAAARSAPVSAAVAMSSSPAPALAPKKAIKLTDDARWTRLKMIEEALRDGSASPQTAQSAPCSLEVRRLCATDTLQLLSLPSTSSNGAPFPAPAPAPMKAINLTEDSRLMRMKMIEEALRDEAASPQPVQLALCTAGVRADRLYATDTPDRKVPPTSRITGTCHYRDSSKSIHVSPTAAESALEDGSTVPPVVPVHRRKSRGTYVMPRQSSTKVSRSSSPHERRNEHVKEFFAAYPKFIFDEEHGAINEWRRLCLEVLEVDPDNKKEFVVREGKRQLNTALVRQFNTRFGTDKNDIASWHALCHVLDIPAPNSLEACREVCRP